MPRMSYSRKICGLTATAVLSAVVVTRCNSLLFSGEEFAAQVRMDARPRPFAPGLRTPQFQRGVLSAVYGAVRGLVNRRCVHLQRPGLFSPYSPNVYHFLPGLQPFYTKVIAKCLILFTSRGHNNFRREAMPSVFMRR